MYFFSCKIILFVKGFFPPPMSHVILKAIKEKTGKTDPENTVKIL